MTDSDTPEPGAEPATRRLIVEADPKNFRITVPAGAKVTFGPWSPAGTDKAARYDVSAKALNGTLRVYASTATNATLLGVFSGVTGFREEGLEYEREEIVLEGSRVWKSDTKGYSSEEQVKVKSNWDDEPKQVGPGDDA